ncbi:MAG: hypothetical protein JWN76_425 [Chitinophagaceae bacterium]|nr:hypothetical protein [Chitinophagaceae bacterium]
MYYTAVIVGYTNLIAAFIGLKRFRVIHYAYRPFLYLVWAGVLFDSLSYISNANSGSNTVVMNVYTLVESLFVIWLFKTWDVTHARKKFYRHLAVVTLILWCTDNLLLYNINHFNALFRICYSFIIIYLALHEINGLLLENRIREWQNARLLVCCAFLLYFTYKALFELFYLDDHILDDRHKIYLFYIMICINALTNLIYAAAMLCIPKKQKFITCHW